MIVVDSRTDSEKLAELLDLVEEEALDYKSETNVSKGKHRLDFVKDAVSMSNRPGGGYILFGVTDDGKPCQAIGTCSDRKQFDGANLGKIVRSYLDGEFLIITQWHQVHGHEVLLAYVPGHRDGLPVPMNSIGQYDVVNPNGKKETKYVFYEGQVWLREGAGNVTLRHAHWQGLLKTHDTQVRADAEAGFQALLRSLSTDSSAPPPSQPLMMSMSLATLADAVASHLDSGKDVRLRQFLSQAESGLSNSGEEFGLALDRLTVVILQSLHFDRSDLARRGVNHLVRGFSALGLSTSDARARLDIITRAYIIGSLAVRSCQWDFAYDLVLNRANSPGYSDYFYSSWIRAGQVDASRSNLLDDSHRGMMISLARDLMQSEVAFRPDVPEVKAPENGQVPENDVLLNSLCQFDLLYALVITAEGKDHGGAYPASSAFLQRRADPMAVTIATDEQTRRTLFPASSDQAVAAAIEEVYEFARRESLMRSSSWWGPPDAATRFIQQVGTSDK